MARVIVHVDLDAFYAAVEQVRLGLPIEQPLAVQQWEGLIAVNYAARAKGVTRFMAIQEAKQKCPELRLVHVEVIGGGSKREEGKVSLERYRQASANILPIFHRFSPLCEKASIDEAYLDLTAQVDALLNQGPEPETAPVYANPETKGSGGVSMDSVQGRDDVIVLDGPLNPDNEYDRRLLAGATICVQLREAVFSELGYTCSAGIAPNKLLAKLASAMNKPYKQTVVTPRAIPGLMQDFPMRKIRNLGGKMGKELCDTLGCETAGDVQKIPEAVLVEKLGDKMGPWVYRAVRGIHDEPVQTRQISKSMLAAKSYSQTNNIDDVRHWLRLLSMELAARIEYDVKLNKRRPKTFHLYYRGFDARRRIQDHSKSCPVPPHIQQLILQIHAGKAPKSPAKPSKLSSAPAIDGGKMLSGASAAQQEGGKGSPIRSKTELDRALFEAKDSGENGPDSGGNGPGEDMKPEGIVSAQLESGLLRLPEAQNATEPGAATMQEQLEAGDSSDVQKDLNPTSLRSDTEPERVAECNEPKADELEPGDVREWADGGRSIAAGIGAALAAGEAAGPLADALYTFGLSVFERAEQNMPSTRVAVAAGDFVDLPVKGAHSITNFFRAGGARDPAEKASPSGGDRAVAATGEVEGGKETGSEARKRPGQKRKSPGIGRFFGQAAPKSDAARRISGGAVNGGGNRQANGTRGDDRTFRREVELPEIAPVADIHVSVTGRSLSATEDKAEAVGRGGDQDANNEPAGSALQSPGVGDKIAGPTGRRSPVDQRSEVTVGLGEVRAELRGTADVTSSSGQIQGLASDTLPLPIPPAETTAEQKPAGISTRELERSALERAEIEREGDCPTELERDAADSDRGALCPELSDVDLRQQKRLMAEFERQKRLVGLVKKRDAEGGSKAGAPHGKKGGAKRKGRPPESEDGQKRILSFLKP